MLAKQSYLWKRWRSWTLRCTYSSGLLDDSPEYRHPDRVHPVGHLRPEPWTAC